MIFSHRRPQAHHRSRWTCPLLVSSLLFASALVAGPASAAEPDRSRLRPATPKQAKSVAAQRVQAFDAAVAGTPRGYPGVSIGADPGNVFGYIPLTAFGSNTVLPVGDEQTVNIDTPAFVYNGETFTRLGINSNGYLIPGGGEAEDNRSDPAFGTARPNGVLAPFWTDLDGTGKPGVLVNVLTDGVSSWLVVEWQVDVAGTDSERVFQAWIGVNGAQDVQYAYRFDTIAESGLDLLVGAENLDGTLSAGLPRNALPTTDLRVWSAEPTPNQVPVAHADAYTTAEDTALSVPAPGALGNDTDGESDALTAELVSEPEHGTVSLDADGAFTYAPDADYNGPDSFTYLARDPFDPSEPVTVTLDVTPVDELPPAIAITGGVGCGSDDRSGTFRLRLTDGDTPATALILSAQSSNPALVPVADVAFADGTARITAQAGRTGSATVTLTVSDGTATASVPVTVRVGGGGSDLFAGTAGSDLQIGQGGLDSLNGLGGVDVLCGGSASDVLTGGNGDDLLDGGAGHDLLFGGAGDDVLHGGTDNDALLGEAGDDALDGAGGLDACGQGSGSGPRTGCEV
ncbi:cadherin-like domain-containing protein [Solirubrobacter sp. CPCC 204708]|uniref:Ig-like domain-containing protein n=1 Tax=Solirubrobacter deserti TaxID=2282478 RepID=A0ABT4RJ92_9ACTN|nr:Ig-like domain-containing protein [Solirubrobacter deserti]MBE2317673.1 cadherin-like domain-containing protein [Solirubrobacter deserti]MDA0138623.1 Ig-like domain-containing protein [Solirubrobacter deserti]